jgi:hypothetical protein
MKRLLRRASHQPKLQVLPPQRRFLFDTIFFPAFSMVTVSFLIVIQLAFSGKNSFAWQALILLPLALVSHLFDLIALFRRSRSVGVDVSDEELRWRQGSRQQSLPWNEVRGWCVVFLPSGGPRSFFTWLSWPNSIRTQPMDAVYALIGDHTSLTWLHHARSTRTAQGSQILAHAIQSRISIPLRDLTPGSARLFKQLQQSNGRARNAALAVRDEGLSQINPAPLLASTTLIFLLSAVVVVAGILTAFSLWRFL